MTPIKQVIIVLLPFLFILPAFTQNPNHENSNSIIESKIQVAKVKANPNQYERDERIDHFLNLASKYFSISYDSATIVYKDMIEFGKSIDEPYMVGIGYNAIGELLRLKGKHRQAIPYFKASDNSHSSDKFPNSKAQNLGVIAGCYFALNQLDSATYYVDQSISLLHEKGDTSHFTNPHLIKGTILTKQEKHFSALDQFLKAEEYASSAILPLRKADVYSKIANTYNLLKDYKKSIDYVDRALEITERGNYANTTSVLNINKGLYLSNLGRTQEALLSYQKGLPHLEKKKTYPKLFNAYTRLAYLFLNEKNTQEAGSYIRKAENVLNHLEQVDSRQSLELLNGKYLTATGRLQEGERVLKNLQLEVENGENKRRLSNIFSALQNNLSKQKKWEAALNYAERYRETRNALETSEQQKLVYDLDGKYQSDLKSTQIAQLSQENIITSLELKQKNNLLWFSILGLLLSLIAGAGFYKAFKTKTRSNELLSEKNDQLSTALSANKMLVKEIHHRVKNNLQFVSSLLSLQSRYEKDQGVLKAINSGKYRVQSLSLLHKNLYVNEDLNSINIKKYFDDLIDNITNGYAQSNKDIQITSDIADIELDLDTVIPLGLISNELITNAYKHAFKNKEEGKLHLRIIENGNEIILSVKDNGHGLPFTELPERSASMGMQLINMFVKKLDGKITIANQNGSEINLTFKKPEGVLGIKNLSKATG